MDTSALRVVCFIHIGKNQAIPPFFSRGNMLEMLFKEIKFYMNETDNGRKLDVHCNHKPLKNKEKKQKKKLKNLHIHICGNILYTDKHDSSWTMPFITSVIFLT